LRIPDAIAFSTTVCSSTNQKLGEQRAKNVTNILLQKGHSSITRMFAPGAMDEAHQVGNDKTGEEPGGESAVVITVLQNEAIAGILRLVIVRGPL
jgi:hypothetical protein